MHQNLFEDREATVLDFQQDKRHRKCYVSSTTGQIKVFNIQNGVALKDVFDDDSEASDSDESEPGIASGKRGRRFQPGALFTDSSSEDEQTEFNLEALKKKQKKKKRPMLPSKNDDGGKQGQGL